MKGNISTIEWPSNLKATQSMCYESIAPLHYEIQTNVSDGHMSFALSSSNFESDVSDLRGCIHKMDIVNAPTLTNAKIKITHEVLPKQGACSQIIPVNDRLRVACFDEGSLLTISNFGPKKTFNCDVRGRLQHHCSPINCVASDTGGSRIATGSAGGDIALHEVSGESVAFTSRVNVCSSPVTGLGYLKPHEEICLRPCDQKIFDGEDILVYSTLNGNIGLLDTRCDLGHRINFARLMTTEPRLNLTSLCYVDSLPGQVIFFGSAHGQLIAIDLRYNNKYLVDRKLPEDGCIRRMKTVTRRTQENESKYFLAYTNETHEIKIIDPSSLEIGENWKCDRLSTGIIRDFCQVEERIITCGSSSSIGCWTWED